MCRNCKCPREDHGGQDPQYGQYGQYGSGQYNGTAGSTTSSANGGGGGYYGNGGGQHPARSLQLDPMTMMTMQSSEKLLLGRAGFNFHPQQQQQQLQHPPSMGPGRHGRDAASFAVGRRFWLCSRGVHLGTARSQTWSGKQAQDKVKQIRQHTHTHTQTRAFKLASSWNQTLLNTQKGGSGEQDWLTHWEATRGRIRRRRSLRKEEMEGRAERKAKQIRQVSFSLSNSRRWGYNLKAYWFTQKRGAMKGGGIENLFSLKRKEEYINWKEVNVSISNRVQGLKGKEGGGGGGREEEKRRRRWPRELYEVGGICQDESVLQSSYAERQTDLQEQEQDTRARPRPTDRPTDHGY